MADRPRAVRQAFAVSVRGLRSRTVLTLGVILLATIGVAAAVVGPMYLRAATNSLLVNRVDAAPLTAAGLTWQFEPSADDPNEAMRAAVDVADNRAPAAFGPTQPSLVSQGYDLPDPVGEDRARLTAFDDGCDRLLLVSGRCPTRPFEILVAPIDIERGGFAVGEPLVLSPDLPRATVVGTYRLRDPGRSWFDPSRYVSAPRGTSLTSPTPYLPAPFVTVPETFESLPSDAWSVQADRRLLVDPTLTPDRADELADLADEERTRQPLASPDGVLDRADRNGLRDIMISVEAERTTARNTVLPAALSLSLVAMLVLLRLLGESADLRRPEFALLALRGWSRRRLWAFGLAEPALVLLLAAPLGCLAGWSIATRMGRSWLYPGLPVDVTPGALMGAATVTAAGLAAAAISLIHVMREQLRDQLVETARPRAMGRVDIVIQSAILVSALVATYAVADRPNRGDPGLVDLLVPVLLALAVGLVAGHLAVVAARLLARRPGRRRRLAGYLASRRLARRREGTLVVLPLSVALGVGVFAFGVHVAAADWRESVAASRVGADVAYSTNLDAIAAMGLTQRLDPEGQWLMAAAVAPAPKEPPVVAVDTRRIANVGLWPAGWGVADGPAAIADEIGSSDDPPRLNGERITLALRNDVEIGEGLTIFLQLQDVNGEIHSLLYSDVPAGEVTVRGCAPYCVDGCDLVGLALSGTGGTPGEMAGELTLHDLRVDRAPVDAGFDEADSWRRQRPYIADGTVVDAVSAGDGLRIHVDSRGSFIIAELTPNDVPDKRPVVVTDDVQLPSAESLGGDVAVLPGAAAGLAQTESQLPVRVVGTSEAVPLLGRTGVLLDLRAYTREAFGAGFGVESYVLARDGTPVDIVDGLAAAGVDVDQPRRLTDERRLLDNDAYALSLRLYVVVAVALLFLALAGVVAHLVIGMPGRRRDAASLRVIGVSKWIVLRAGLVDLSVTLGVAAVAGLVAGVLAQRVVLGQIRLGTADAQSPDLPASIDLATLSVYSVATAGALVIVASIVAWASIRQARGAELRESAR
ncbi:MAG TPA: ABC transporter permease [Nocardioidaceae bacterium]|nr:ABC transporter permease [Nocardioidaceae bacterium]